MRNIDRGERRRWFQPAAGPANLDGLELPHLG